MVVIRLARSGAKKSPFYHLVAADSRAPRDGRYIEQLGYFNPSARGQAVRLEVKKERVDHWISQGAQPSERVQTLLKDFASGNIESAPTMKEYKLSQAEQSVKAAAKKAKASAEAEAPAEKTDDSAE